MSSIKSPIRSVLQEQARRQLAFTKEESLFETFVGRLG